jgi:isoleucyl-tRNA synthetase
MNTELSAFYFDIRKDTLYCDPPSSLARKAALTAIDIICDAILRWFAPVLSFTSDEAWQIYRPGAEPSVHLTLFPDRLETFRDEKLAAKWEIVRDVRRVVTGALELERAAKRIGSSLEASPLVYVSDRRIFDTLLDLDLAEVFITSNAMATNEDAPADAFRLNDVPGVAVVVEKAQGTKCARSWKILPSVGEDREYPDVSPRDAMALREWEKLGGGAQQPVADAPVRPVVPARPAAAIEKRPTSAEAAPRLADSMQPQAGGESLEPAAGQAKGAAKNIDTGRSGGAAPPKRARATKSAKKTRTAKSAGKRSAAAKRKKVAKAAKAAKPTRAAKKRAGKTLTKAAKNAAAKKKPAKKGPKTKRATGPKKAKKKKKAR